MSNNASGQRLVNVVGANGIRFYLDEEQDTYAFGYPSNYANGNVMHYCSGRSGWRGYFDPKRMYLTCDFQAGSSGGPWVMDFDGELGWLFSITTTGNEVDEIRGIKFEESERNLYNDVRVRY